MNYDYVMKPRNI